jgi:hypothetical protein
LRLLLCDRPNAQEKLSQQIMPFGVGRICGVAGMAGGAIFAMRRACRNASKMASGKLS